MDASRGCRALAGRCGQELAGQTVGGFGEGRAQVCGHLHRHVAHQFVCALRLAPSGPTLKQRQVTEAYVICRHDARPNTHGNRLLTETEQIMISGRASTGQAVWEGLTCVGSRLGSTQVGEDWSGGGDAACARWRMRRLGVRSSTCRIVPEAVSIP